jgi:hypothetical protein
MKTRSGFVSNSSSSSYIVILKNIFFSAYLGLDDVNASKDSAKYYARGNDTGDGVDFFELDATMIEFLRDHFNDMQSEVVTNNMCFYKVYGMISLQSSVREFRKILDTIPDTEIDQVVVQAEDISIHSTSGVKELRSNYFPHVPEVSVLSDKELKRIEQKIREEIRSLDTAKQVKTAQLKEIKKKTGKRQ